MSVEFEDFSMKVMSALDDATIASLYEVAGELTSQVQRNMPPGTWYSEIKGKWNYDVDESEGVATVGNPLEASLWVEFGTGEFSISPKGGRKGYWIYVKDSDSGIDKSYAYKGGKSYTLEEAKHIVAMMRDDGLDAHYTKGQTPKRPLHNAFTKMKPTIKKMFEQEIGGKML